MDSIFSKDRDLAELIKVSAELTDIACAGGVLSWDQETYMPPKGAGIRAYQLSTLAGIYHDKLTAARVGKILDKLGAKREKLNEYDLALMREFKREYDKATKLPKKLVKDISEATSRAFDSWQKAKKADDFPQYVPNLEKLLELKIAAAQLLVQPGQSLYDTMLDDYEQDLTEKEIERVFGGVRVKLSELAKKLSRVTKDADQVFAGKNYPVDAQWKWGLEIISDMGYDMEAGRQDKSAHPFTINFGVGDVRITTWENDDDPRPMLFATIHEAGHALYEQGVDPRFERTHLSGGQGLVVHESQSRLWENMIGRSGEMWEHYYGRAQELIPSLKDVSREQFVKAINVVKPSLIRVEADEVTYGLHIILRFEIEKELIAGKMKVKDLPGVWKQKMAELVGVVPDNDREGVLQDVHWSHGSFGYFPTYLLGTMTSAQLWHKLQSEGDMKTEVRTGNLKILRDWLRNNLHKYGRLYTSGELIKKMTGEELNSKYYIEYLENKFEKLYN